METDISSKIKAFRVSKRNFKEEVIKKALSILELWTGPLVVLNYWNGWVYIYVKNNLRFMTHFRYRLAEFQEIHTFVCSYSSRHLIYWNGKFLCRKLLFNLFKEKAHELMLEVKEHDRGNCTEDCRDCSCEP